MPWYKPVVSKVGKLLMVLACVLHGGAYLFAQSEHVADASWPIHARFHTFQALLWIVGLDLVLLLVALVGATERWARWGLLGGAVAAHGAYFVALAVMPEGSPPEGMRAHLPLAAIGLCFATGWVLAWRGART